MLLPVQPALSFFCAPMVPFPFTSTTSFVGVGVVGFGAIMQYFELLSAVLLLSTSCNRGSLVGWSSWCCLVTPIFFSRSGGTIFPCGDSGSTVLRLGLLVSTMRTSSMMRARGGSGLVAECWTSLATFRVGSEGLESRESSGDEGSWGWLSTDLSVSEKRKGECWLIVCLMGSS